MNIELEKWKLEDADRLMQLCNHVERQYLSDRIPFPYTNDSANWWLNMVFENEGKSALFRKIVVDGVIVGTISIEQKSDVYRKDAEIGYFLLSEQYAKGIMSIAVGMICDIAFKKLDIVRITGLVYENNIASRKVLEKNNFVLEGIMKNAVVKNDVLHNLCVYGKYK